MLLIVLDAGCFVSACTVPGGGDSRSLLISLVVVYMDSSGGLLKLKPQPKVRLAGCQAS